MIWRGCGFISAAVVALWCFGSGCPAASLRVIDPAENNRRFSRAQVVSDAREGKGAFLIEPTPGKVSFHAMDIRDVDIDLSEYAGLAFWWKVEGDGLKNFSVKTRFPTMREGRQTVLPVWRAGTTPPPREWTSGVVLFSDTTGWHGDPSRARVIEFRVHTGKGADVRLYIDQVAALPGAFALKAETPRLDKGEWRTALHLKGESDNEIRVVLGVGDRKVQEIELLPKGEVDIDMPLPMAADALDDLKPLESVSVNAWAQIGDDEITRQNMSLRVYKPIPLPPRPRLMVDAEQIAKIKARIETHDWARKRWEVEKAQADKHLERELKIPPRGGASGNSYANPETGGRLRATKQIGEYQWEHVDKKTGKVFLGKPTSEATDYDAVKIEYIHMSWARRAVQLALVYQISGDERYAQKAREIVVTYGKKFLDYPLDRYGTGKTHGKGRVTANYLTESHWVIYMCETIDMIWDVLTEDERRMLADNMLYPALRDSIRPVRCYVHNIQCWKNSAKILTGLLYEDPELIHSALYDNEEGYWMQLEKGVLPGGVWYEGSWGYHFYTMMAIVPLTEAARHCGIEVYVDTLKEMYLAPTRFPMPDLRLPNFNDAGLMNLVKTAPRYELAAARWPDEEAFRSMVVYSSRATREALLHGVDLGVSEKKGLPIRSVNYEGAGYATLAKGEGKDATWLTLKYSPPSKYHGHPDRLHFILYARGEIVAVDPGSVAYHVPIQAEWYKTTLAHNTLMVDEESQVKAAGNCLAFGSKGEIDYAMLDDGEAIENVRFVRTAAMLNKDLIVIIDQVRADKERLLDFAYHQAGEWVSVPPGKAGKPPEKVPYSHLRNATQRDATQGMTASTRVSDGFEPAIAVAAGDPTFAITATGPGIGGASNQTPCLILRRRQKDTALAWAIALDGKAPKLTLESVRGSDGKDLPAAKAVALRVESAGKTTTLVANPDGVAIEGVGSERFAVK